ncbi:MAG: transcriptional regulator, AraC family [Acidobacteriaceae bacterium]|nr:transcriptional regulator, AraC family [Acidobacteriaceae bacterium]
MSRRSTQPGVPPPSALGERVSVMVGDRSVPLLPGTPITPGNRSPWTGILLEKHRIGAVEIPEHEHHTFTLHLQTSGPVAMDWNSHGKSGHLNTGAGSLIFLTPGTRDSILWHGPSQRIIASVDPTLLARAATQLELPHLPDFDNRWSFEDQQLALLLTEMEREIAAGSSTGPLYGDLLGLSLSVALIRKYGHTTAHLPPQKGGLSRPTLNRVLDSIAANLTAKVRLDDLATIAGLSPFHFARAFRESTGTTPHQYLLQRRIDTAKALLRGPARSLDAIATATGFADAAHLSKAFRRLTGTSPIVWKRNR